MPAAFARIPGRLRSSAQRSSRRRAAAPEVCERKGDVGGDDGALGSPGFRGVGDGSGPCGGILGDASSDGATDVAVLLWLQAGAGRGRRLCVETPHLPDYPTHPFSLQPAPHLHVAVEKREGHDPRLGHDKRDLQRSSSQSLQPVDAPRPSLPSSPEAR